LTLILINTDVVAQFIGQKEPDKLVLVKTGNRDQATTFLNANWCEI